MLSPGRCRRSAAGVGLAVTLGLLPGTAAAAVSTVTLAITDATFHGTVGSPRPVCTVGRKVQLVRIEPDTSRTVVASTYTTESGHYSTVIPQQHDQRYFARVKRVVTPGGRVCARDVSMVKIA